MQIRVDEGLRGERESPHHRPTAPLSAATRRPPSDAMPRLFTALEIPTDVGQSLSMLRGGLPGARWIDPDNYHLTLRFIGDIDDVLSREMAFMLGGVRRLSFELRLGGLSSFGGGGGGRGVRAGA